MPWTLDRVFVWVTLGLLVLSLRSPKAWARGVIVDWLPLFLVLTAYGLLRGYADHLLFPAHALPQLRFDEVIGAGTAPTVRLQHAFYDKGHPHVWDYVAWFIYLTHFFLVPLVAAVLWKFRYQRFRRFVGLYLALTFMGFATYVLYPAVPPWLASVQGHLVPTQRIIGQIWNHIGVHTAGAMYDAGSRYVNDVAAVPSLHGAYPMLLALFFWPRRRWARVLLLLYPLAMGVVLVYTAEHYVLDILVGWAYAIGLFAFVGWVGAKRSVRRYNAAGVSQSTASSAGDERPCSSDSRRNALTACG
jgi:hypothetical protein